MDPREFHERAKRLRPKEVLPAKRYWVGVLYHYKQQHEAHEENDFLWIKAHSKVTIGKVLAQYVQRYKVTPVLKLGHLEPLLTSKLSELNFYEDNMIVLEALDPLTLANSLESLNPSRPPLQPINRQLPTNPRHTPSRSIISPQDEFHNNFQDKSRDAPSVHSKGLEGSQQPSETMLGTRDIAPSGSIFGQPMTQNNSNINGTASKQKENLPNPQLQEGGHLTIIEPNLYDLLSANQQHSVGGFASTLQPPQLNTAGTEPEAEPTLQLSTQSTFPNQIKTEEDGNCQMMNPAKLESEEQEQVDTPKADHLGRLLQCSRPEVLEAGVQTAKKILHTLKNTMSGQISAAQDARQWIAAIENLENQAIRKQTVVGVVGNTGAGKSSVINAMLDEERLVPTNCMRACTAVVTELSWNESNDEQSRYQAEIEFIAKEDWEKELRILLNDVLDESGGVSWESRNPDSDAGIAWAKFQAVYPDKTKDMLPKCTVPKLMAEPSIIHLLGTSKKINEKYPEVFYRRLQHFVDSKEKITGQKKDKENEKKRGDMEYWPLIKVVKIFTKSPALSTGAVVVDLPGVHDSNAARAAVAQGYMKQCAGLWIVAPITRAVDDKAAKTLLGNSFKRQLKYDGTYNHITFICSKTDDISITEASDSLELNEEIEAYETQKDIYTQDIKRLQEETEKLLDSKKVYKQMMDDRDDEIEVWEGLRDDLDAGKVVYEPKTASKKRKRNGEGKKKWRKPYQRSDSESDEHHSSDSDTSMRSNGSVATQEDDVVEDRMPLTEGAVRTKIDDLKTSKKAARRERSECEQCLRLKRDEIKTLKEKVKEVQAEMSAICIAGRNRYSKGAIQTDFASGIKELDQENAIEQDEATFNPSEDQRNYEEVARLLPVFCVSSRAYQKMCGRLKKDGAVPGFKTMEETEIPQLQAHCKKLTEGVRVQSCHSFLGSLSQLLNSLSLWSSNNGTGPKLSDIEKYEESRILEKKLNDLETGLESAITNCVREMKKDLTDNIYDRFGDLIEEASSVAPNTVAGWGAHRNAGGLCWATYKALVRRDGVYTSATAGARDFNAELMEPINKRLATGWERAFQRRLPNILRQFSTSSGVLLQAFHGAVDARARRNGAGIANLQMLAGQLRNYEQSFAGLAQNMVNLMTELQREANRSFTPVIAAAMHSAYETAAAERGAGSYMRMKQTMMDHIEHERHQMFNQATNGVKTMLDQMCKQIEEQMANYADAVFVRMRQDYLNIVGGAQMHQGELMPKVERKLRIDVRNVLLAADDKFEAVGKGDIEHAPAQDKEVGNNELHHAAENEDYGDKSAFANATANFEDVRPDTEDGDVAAQTTTNKSTMSMQEEVEMSRPMTSDLECFHTPDQPPIKPKNGLEGQMGEALNAGSETYDGSTDNQFRSDDEL